MGSDMNFYKIDDQDFVFSVKTDEAGTIRYYRLQLSDDRPFKVSRIRNAFAFLDSRDIPKVKEFSPDYIKVVTSLVEYCDSEEQIVTSSQQHRKAIDYKHIKHPSEDTTDDNDRRKRRINNAKLIVASRASAQKSTMMESDQLYDISQKDMSIITAGITNNNFVNSFKIR
ncbi:MAG: hypothetical protein J1F35_01345 [Erysipelotrichales bacterium]|nr:hypothetical protein [Erysipelotrichales bacterium]